MMIGAVVFVASFVLFTLVSLAVDLPPGLYVHDWFNIPASEYSSLINSIVNGVVYSVIIRLVFSFAKMASRKPIMGVRVKDGRFYLLDAPKEAWIYGSADGALEASETLLSKKELNPEEVNVFEVNIALARDTWLSRLKKASKEVSEIQFSDYKKEQNT